ncbi:anti-sigma factor antagonist [Streptomyces sp. NPDC056568]|uniref:anti-sigma factor antagonist n=1 Tax=Streptomyces sp. NPDC056568 TaxID=3345866 RepID=UPI003688D7D2
MRQEPASSTRHLHVRHERGHTVLELRGEIDIASAAEVAPHLDREAGRPGARVVLDLGGVDFFDCSGLRLLYRVRRRALDHGGQVHLVCTHPLTLRMLRITGLARLLPPRATLEEVLGVTRPAEGRTGH